GFSMIKRRITDTVQGRSYWSQCRELWLLAITYNLMLLYATTGFLQSKSGPITLIVDGPAIKIQSAHMVHRKSGCPASAHVFSQLKG
ncbi:MAG TPA: hypothetical protein VG097_13010, partial [Gemmata sp.]|nr:hypothetical protein [Gemmata sp.]